MIYIIHQAEWEVEERLEGINLDGMVLMMILEEVIRMIMLTNYYQHNNWHVTF